MEAAYQSTVYEETLVRLKVEGFWKTLNLDTGPDHLFIWTDTLDLLKWALFFSYETLVSEGEQFLSPLD